MTALPLNKALHRRPDEWAALDLSGMPASELRAQFRLLVLDLLAFAETRNGGI